MFKPAVTLRNTLALAGLGLVVAVLVSLPAPSADADVNASLVCEPTFNGALCEARPINFNYTYQWSTSGDIYKPSPCSGPICSISCVPGIGHSGTVTVKITAPDGSSDTASRGISC